MERREMLTVLDVGGGTGGFAVPLAEAGHRVTVVDASPDALAALTRRAAEAGVADRITAVQGDGDRLAELAAPGSADLILCHSLLEVVDDPTEVVAALAATLRPGGAASLPDVLPSALAALGIEGFPDPLGLRERLAGVRRIAVLLVDGLGHRLLPLAAPVAPVIADVLAGRLGTVLELTSPFPSTTPTSLVSFGTGVPPGQHGQVGFFLAIPGTDRILDTLTWRDDPDPCRWQPVPTVFIRAAAAGVRVSVASLPEY